MCEDTQDRSDHLETAIVQILVKAKRHPISFQGLLKEIARKIDSQKEGRINTILESLIDRDEVLIVADGSEQKYFLRDNLGHLKARLCEILRVHHTKHSYEPGMKVSEIRKNFSKTQTQNKARNVDAHLFELAYSACLEDASIVETDGSVHLPGFTPKGPGDEEIARLEAAVLGRVVERRHQRMDLDKLSISLGRERRLIKTILARSISSGRLVLIEEGRYLEPSEIEQAKRILSSKLANGGRIHLSQIVEALGLSRMATISLLEFFDRNGFTRRDGDYRELCTG